MDDASSDARADLPAPIAIGSDDYYLERAADFRRRTTAEKPPSYYLEYGDKCLRQFRAAKHNLSPAGQVWMEKTLRLLQESIESKRQSDPEAFGRLEHDDDKFQDFAFSTHADAYDEAGILTLPADDLWQILRTPDTSDLLSRDGIEAILELLGQVGRDDVAHIIERQGPKRIGLRLRTVIVGLGARLRR